MTALEKRSILFICVHNSARSQMAEEYLRHFAGDIFDTESAGLEPGTLNPYVVEVLKEEGIDISGKKTQSVFDLFKAGKEYTYVIAVCSKEAEEKCPIFPGPVKRYHWPFTDPSSLNGSEEQKLAHTRRIRDEIKAKVRDFVEDYRSKRDKEMQ